MRVFLNGRWWGAGDSAPRRLGGVFTASGSSGYAESKAFESETGMPVKVFQDFQDKSAIAPEPWVVSAWSDLADDELLDLSLSMLPGADSTATHTKGAAGSYDSEWTAYFDQWAVSPVRDRVLFRLGREFNTSGYKWYVSNPNEYDDFVTYWRRVVGIARSKYSGFKFVWCPNWGNKPTEAIWMYPGDDYVDYVGVDVYDASWASYKTTGDLYYPPSDPSTWDYRNWDVNNADHTARRKRVALENIYGYGGVAHWAGFAKAHGKLFCIPEWGLWDRSSGSLTDHRGGMDNPYFIHAIADFIESSDVEYHCYFNHDNGNYGDHSLTSHNGVADKAGAFPLALEAFKQRFGGSM